MRLNSLKIKAIFALTVGAILSILSSASAATVTWDANAATASQTDGAGAWLTADQWWNGSSNVTWTSGDDAVFGNGGAGGAVTLDSGTTVGSITFNSFTGTYTLGTAGQTITLSNGITKNSGSGAATIISPITLGAAQSWTNNSASLLTIGTGAVTNAGYLLTIGGTGNTSVSSAIGGSGGLTKNGAGTLTLSGTNTYTGGTVINAGTLNTTTPDTNLGTGPVTVTGTVTWNFGNTGSSRNLTINDGAALSITGLSNQNFSGVLAGNGSISQTSFISINFTNTGNTFTGPINIGYGLTFTSLGDSTNPINLPSTAFTWTGGANTFALRPFTLSSAGTGTIGNNGTGALTIQQPLAFSGAAGARTLSLGGTYTASANTFAGNITDGPGSVVSLTKSAAPIWALSGTNTYSGATTALGTIGGGGAFVFQGIQALSPYTSLRGGSNPSDGGTRPAPFRILDDSANPASRSGVNLFLTTGNSQDPLTIFVGNNNTSNGGNSSGTTTGSTIQLGNMNFSQVTTSTAGGALDVQGANNYKLQIGNINITLGGTGTPVAWNTKLNPTTASLIVTGNVQQTAGGVGSVTTNLQLDGTATGNLISGSILNSADATPRALSVSKAGTSTWTLSGTNTYTGTTTLSGGTLSINSIGNVNGGSSALGNPSSAANGTIAIGSTTIAATLVYTGSAATTDRVINLAGTTGGATLDQSGSGLLKFTSALTATGAGSKTLTLQGSTNGTGEIAAAIVDNSGTHKTSVVKGGTGAWTLSGTNTNTGTTTINAGTLQLAKQVSLYNNTTASWTAANINVKSGGTLAFNVGGTGEFTTGDFTTLLTNLAASSSATNGMNAGSSFGFDTTNATDGTFTIADVIANSTGTSGGARGLTKLGTNTLILTNTNTYTGATTINAGKLLVHGSTAAGSAFTVNSSATLGGSGTINGTVTLMSGATLSPGASIESLGLGSSAWNGGSTVQIEFSTDGSTGVAGTEWDLLAITGTLDLTGASSSTPVILDLVSMVNATTAGALAVWDENVNANLQSPVLKVSFRRTRRVG
jgi:autotransporter-associated beta strand protein